MDCVRCLIGISKLLKTLIILPNEAPSNDAWFSLVQALVDKPINQYRSTVEQLQSKLTPTASNGLETIVSRLVRDLGSEKVFHILLRVERLKSLVQIALEMNHLKA